MAWLFLKLHALVVAAVWGLAGLLGRSVGRFLLAVWLLLNEEVRRYTGLVVWGVVIVLAGKGTLNYAPTETKQPLLLTVLALLGIWALAVRRAVHLTRANSLFRVQNRKAFRDLTDEVKGGREDLLAWMARATQNRLVGLAFKSTRQRRAADRAAAEAQRLADAEQAETDRRAREDYDRWAEQAGRDHDPFAKQGS